MASLERRMVKLEQRARQSSDGCRRVVVIAEGDDVEAAVIRDREETGFCGEYFVVIPVKPRHEEEFDME